MSQIKLTADSGGGTTSLKAPSSTTSNADVVLKLPVADGNSGEILKTDGSGQLSFGSNAGTTINNNADNRIITGSGTASTLNGESSLTYDGSDLNISNDVPQLILTDTNSNNSYGRVRGNGGNLILSADHGGATAGSVILAEIDGSEKVRIDSSGRVGIKNTSMSSFNDGMDDLVIGNGVNGTSPGMTIYSNSSDIGTISFTDDASTGITGLIQYRHNESPPYMRIMVEGTQRASFTTHGGIAFNSDTAAANTLDDYEEGTFTPALSGFSSISYHRQKGHYTKIGRQVWMHIYLYIYQATGDSNVVTITGLPFTSSNADSGHIQNGGHIWYQNDTFKSSFESNGRPYLYIGSNSNYVQFRNQGGGDITGENTYLGGGANNRYITCGVQMIV